MPKILLKGGFVTDDIRLDRIYPGVEQHFPSLNFLAVRGTDLEHRRERSYTWRLSDYFDQGQEGRCVEYATVHELRARPVVVDISIAQEILAGKKIYWPAQQEDYWPGGSYPGADPIYEGTSVLAAMKVATRLGFYQEYRWGLDARDLALVVGYKGPAVLGINWYEQMFNTDEHGFVHVAGNIAGGHGILCVAVKICRHGDGSIDVERSYFVLHNSWGPGWGQNGRCKVMWRDMERLIAEQGEIALPVRRGFGNG